MRKTKLAICFEDKEYQKRFVKCFMHHYDEHYEVHIFGSNDELKQNIESDFQIILLEEVEEGLLKGLETNERSIFCLTEEWNTSDIIQKERIIYLSKYQEVYKIEQYIKENLREQSKELYGKEKICRKKKLIGVFSLDCESYQIPFCGMVAAEYGESQETLLLNLQAASGLGVSEMEHVEVLSMEDLLAAVATDSYTKNRLLGGIVHETNWDYVYPARNALCLVEASGQMYEKLLDVLSYELDYECIILNFGMIFSNVFTLMEKCEVLYLLVTERVSTSWREKALHEELLRQGKGALFQNAVRIAVSEPAQPCGDWRYAAQNLRWSNTGDQFRKYRQMEKVHG